MQEMLITSLCSVMPRLRTATSPIVQYSSMLQHLTWNQWTSPMCLPIPIMPRTLSTPSRLRRENWMLYQQLQTRHSPRMRRSKLIRTRDSTSLSLGPVNMCRDRNMIKVQFNMLTKESRTWSLVRTGTMMEWLLRRWEPINSDSFGSQSRRSTLSWLHKVWLP